MIKRTSSDARLIRALGITSADIANNRFNFSQKKQQNSDSRLRQHNLEDVSREESQIKTHLPR